MRKFLGLIVVLLSTGTPAQKYNFVNWTVEDGLIQSQASFIGQDNFRQLWVGTEGGLSRFDGKKFKGYTVQEGLVSNRINAIHTSANGDLWIGTNNGLSHFDGKKFTSVFTGTVPINNISAIAETDRQLFAVNNFELYVVSGHSSTKLNISGDTAEKVTSLYSDSHSALAFVFKKGIYHYINNKWRILVTETGESFFIRKFFISSGHDTILLTNQGLYKLVANKLQKFVHPSKDFADTQILCIAEDHKQKIWLGSDKGVYKLEGNEIIHFNETRGFTDNSVNHIFKDAENNLWFATNGDGIYKFRENTFTYYDKSTGLTGTIIIGVAQTENGNIYAGSFGGGIYKISDKGDLRVISDKTKTFINSKINCIYADQNSLLIGTTTKGFWKLSETGEISQYQIKSHPNLNIQGITCIFRDHQQNLLIASQQGLFLINKNDSLRKIKLNIGLPTAMRQFDNDHIIVGTSKGIYILDVKYHAEPFHEKLFSNTPVLCLAKNGNNVWIGTTDRGVLNWNFETEKMITYNSTNGLPSNFIYSMDVSDKTRAWIGTGFGISNLQLDGDGKVLAIKNYGRSDGLLGMECNHNSILKARDSSLWFGTTKGLFHFNPNTYFTEKNKPFVLLRSVKLFSDAISDSTLYKTAGTWFSAPGGLKLRAKQNHLTFELNAIYFTNPDDILFRYKLEGIDKNYTSGNNPLIIYPALPPGKYTFKVSAVTKSGVHSINTISYDFEIEKAFYQTRFFQVMVILLLVSSGALIAYLVTRGRQRRKQREKEILEKIREEEFIKLRQRTAEDFHDEMGNSLTRISVLTDVLKTKINGKEQDVTKLVQQIKENTTALYNGSRDIIWSLNSQNDGLYEIVEHAKDIGNELCSETNIDFQYEHNVPSFSRLKLKLDYSRNLIMIFKEAYSNIIKHSHAGTIKVTVDLQDNTDLLIFIRDNGNGFDLESDKVGNGIRNMNNRAKRMNGKMTVNTGPGKGTEIQILLKNIFA